MLNSIFAIVPLISLLALTFAYVFFRQMMKSSEGTDAMKRIAQHVRTGAGAYLRQQYKVVVVVFIVITIIFSILAYGLGDRKSTRLNSSHVRISYAVFCL